MASELVTREPVRAVQAAALTGHHVEKKRRPVRWRSFLPVYLLMLPGLIYLLVNNYIPMAGIISAFKRININDGIFFSPWAGWDNFRFLFASGAAGEIFRNTLLYNLAFIVVTTTVAIGLAILINDVASTRLRKLYQSSILLPFTLSMVILSYVVFGFLSHENGLLNNTIYADDPIQWYSEGQYWPTILIVVNLWKTVGYSTLLFMAGLIGIDRALYEAASLDGANRWKQVIHIDLPSLVPTIVTLTLLAIGRIFYSDFGLFYQVPRNSGAIYDVTTTIDTYVYRTLISAGGIGQSAAAGFFQAVIGFVLVVTVNAAVRKYQRASALF
ncbi:MAG: ABC transporter permease subunit [Candidatus Microbacterium phytovorans]|uniref:ABC transporter permease subunit n=1 Tax=Candidatus Microbacterium phytovorans TaxID=3121374 RepID=A0AAJ5W0H1_9MICO|nr:ABC transporter permease subunit [Microbacterium sp.]WEK12779.1 MAG: ABC transporter permease subunit [Microbacterium sp.]